MKNNIVVCHNELGLPIIFINGEEFILRSHHDRKGNYELTAQVALAIRADAVFFSGPNSKEVRIALGKSN